MEKTLKDIVQYVRKNYFSYWVILGIDTAISVLCSLVAYVVIHYMARVPLTDWMLCKFACVSLVASVAGSLLFHTYRNTIRFSQARELWRIMCAAVRLQAVRGMDQGILKYRRNRWMHRFPSYPA